MRSISSRLACLCSAAVFLWALAPEAAFASGDNPPDQQRYAEGSGASGVSGGSAGHKSFRIARPASFDQGGSGSSDSSPAYSGPPDSSAGVYADPLHEVTRSPAPAAPLTGGVRLDVGQQKRLDRSQIARPRKLKREEGRQGGYPRDSLGARTPDIGAEFPSLRPRTASSAPLQSRARKSRPPIEMKKPYTWQMSRDGGYYDATGQIKGTVPGDQLYKYGGFMGDGVTPVPSGPVPTNAMGHIHWAPSWRK